jgi:16S rRNA (uracil1498-N3)-methyltransferase
VFFDGTGPEHEAEIESLEKDKVVFRVVESRDIPARSKTKLALAISLIKKDNLEWVIQKGTELGVSEIDPVMSERSEKKGFNIERAKKIAIEASEQSGRGDVPDIQEPLSLSEFLERDKRTKIAFHTKGDVFDASALRTIRDAKDIVAFIGPEGGFSESEIDSLKKKGARVFRLDAPVLRAETAAVAIAALILLP